MEFQGATRTEDFYENQNSSVAMSLRTEPFHRNLSVIRYNPFHKSRPANFDEGTGYPSIRDCQERNVQPEHRTNEQSEHYQRYSVIKARSRNSEPCQNIEVAKLYEEALELLSDHWIFKAVVDNKVRNILCFM